MVGSTAGRLRDCGKTTGLRENGLCVFLSGLFVIVVFINVLGLSRYDAKCVEVFKAKKANADKLKLSIPRQGKVRYSVFQIVKRLIISTSFSHKWSLLSNREMYCKEIFEVWATTCLYV